MKVRLRTAVRARRRLMTLVGALVCVGAFTAPAQADPVIISSCPRQPHPSVTQCSLTVTGSQALGTLSASATFTIAPGFTNVQITLASYTKPPPAFVTTFPQ